MATITAQTKTKTTPRMVRGAAGLPRLARRFAACASRGAALPPSRALGRTKSRDLHYKKRVWSLYTNTVVYKQTRMKARHTGPILSSNLIANRASFLLICNDRQ